MKPGRNLDALIAKEIMGETVVKITAKQANDTLVKAQSGGPARTLEIVMSLVKGFCVDNVGVSYPLQRYSKDIKAAWEVAKSFDDGDYYVSFKKVEGGIYVTLNGVGALGETQAHGLCLAALKKKGIEV